MPQWKFLVSDNFNQRGLDILSSGGEVDYFPEITPTELADCIDQYQALLVRSRTKVTADLITRASNLRVVGRAGVGVDNINLAAAQKHGITVLNTPTSTTIAVAEHTFALLLALIRRVPQADTALKTGLWIKKQLLGSELHGKTLGIVGCGSIGCEFAKRAAAFDMEVLGCDLSEDIVRDSGSAPVTFDELLVQSDFISIHVPLNPQTRGMINGQTLSQMKRGVIIVCTARGGIIDEMALLSALESGQVAGAALDVFAEEPPGLTALVSHPNVVATPHIGAQTAEAQVRAAQDLAEEVLAAIKGEPLRWQVV